MVCSSLAQSWPPRLTPPCPLWVGSIPKGHVADCRSNVARSRHMETLAAEVLAECAERAEAAKNRTKGDAGDLPQP